MSDRIVITGGAGFVGSHLAVRLVQEGYRVFRMSCIYGPHQFGNEDQCWVVHFLIQALHNRPLKLYGDGRQVTFADWRQGDQKYSVTDTGLFRKMTGWHQATTIESGLLQLYNWVDRHLIDRQANHYSLTSVSKGALRNANFRSSPCR